MQRVKSKKIIVPLLLVIFIIFFIIYKSFFSSGKVAEYITGVAERGNIEVSVLADGIIKPQNLVAIGAQTSGKITDIQVVPGSKVNKDQTIATIESIDQKNNLKKVQYTLAIYKSKLAQQKIQLQISKEKLERGKNLLKSNAITLSSYKDALAQVEINKSLVQELEAQIAQSEIDVQIAQSVLSHTQIKSPSDGTILATLVQAGQNINAMQSVPIVAILGDLQKMKIYAQISEADINKVKIGQEVYFNVVGDPNKIYHAHLETIDPAPETIRSDITFNPESSTIKNSAIYYNGTFTVDNTDKSLLTYMNCEVHIILGKASNVILVPSSALKNIRDNTAQIEVKHDNNIEMRNVKIGLNNKVTAQITSGINEGETVILFNGAPAISTPVPHKKHGR